MAPFALTKKYKINRNRPTIGVTGPDRGGGTAWAFTALAVMIAGGWPVRITPNNPRTADGLQALIIGGGADVDPSTYQQDNVLDEYLQRTIREPKKNIFQRIGKFISWLYYPAVFLIRRMLSRKQGWTIDPDRDHLEFQLIDQAVKKGLPVMGICRGSQLLNVYFGGTLYQDINTFYLEEPNPSSVFPVKRVYLKPGSKLARILGMQQLEVNALHHQAVKEPGDNIQIVGQEPNAIVQAIENIKQDYIVGVQWHPEYLPQFKQQRRLFQALVQHAREVQLQIEDTDMQEALASPRAQVLVDMEEKEKQLLQEFTDRYKVK
ncbi:putative glutamine amidotransferase [Pontibacter ummariensis]|uniref:Putative glutamine amidotransferase n=1 Tax=Pontibacter ummariensis TaxID=1610492 RepID=A0A239IAI2_9BACT|nr:gamma-glutamyl-gamma-aminobutyrate hydrolase family protein [Pontibacter ummariensis]PRY09956.1 putative glutamine amidotransferase [Pontibacter ummariensis]SNS90620.1 putative glutamine amidotransferase [Pontibacter ummariensis]